MYRRILRSSAALVAVSIIAAFAPASAKDYSAQLQQVAKTLNTTLPRMVDNGTRLDHTEAGPGNTFTYDYTLVPIASTSALAPKFAAAARNFVLSRACHDPSVMRMLKLGVEMHYVYRGNDGGVITSFGIHASDCGSA